MAQGRQLCRSIHSDIRTETETGQRLEGVTGHTVHIRYRGDVTTDWRLKCGSRFFFIRGMADEQGNQRILTLLAEETQEATSSN